MRSQPDLTGGTGGGNGVLHDVQCFDRRQDLCLARARPNLRLNCCLLHDKLVSVLLCSATTYSVVQSFVKASHALRKTFLISLLQPAPEVGWHRLKLQAV